MDLSKRYIDTHTDKKVDILHMVRHYPEWAANRIQVGERAIAALTKNGRASEQGEPQPNSQQQRKGQNA